VNQPEIKYCTTSDGVSIAYWTMGEGPAVVNLQPPPWNNIEFEAKEWPMHGIIASRCRLIRYDHRGTGSSHREVEELSLDAHVQDLEAVVDRLDLDQFVLLAFGGPIAITYAARHPERVSHLLMYGAVARMADQYDLPRMRNAYAILDSGDWEMFTDTLGLAWAGWADSGLARDLSKFYRTCTEPEVARKTIKAYSQVDVTDLLPGLQVPVSIVYPKESPVTDINIARSLAAAIPNARLTIADSTTGWSAETQEAFFAVLDEALAEMTGNPILVRREAAPGDLVTILFTDVEGSTALTDRLGDAKARDLLHEHERITREALKQHAGSEVKTMGDGFMASFSSATKALECSIAIQQAFAERNESADEPIKVRIGLNAGEPIAEDDPSGRGDLFGTSVNMAARIAAKAEGGEILASNVVRELVAGKEFLFNDRGDTELRGFEDPVRVYEVRWRAGD